MKYQARAHATFAGFMPQGLHPAAWLEVKTESLGDGD